MSGVVSFVANYSHGVVYGRKVSIFLKLKVIDFCNKINVGDKISCPEISCPEINFCFVFFIYFLISEPKFHEIKGLREFFSKKMYLSGYCN